MKKIVSALHSLLSSEVLCTNKTGVKVVEEKNGKEKCQYIDIKCHRGSVVVVKLDKQSQFSRYINASHPKANKSCDALVLLEYDGRKYFVLIELKSCCSSSREPCVQLICSNMFLDYLRDLLRYCCRIDTSDFEVVYFICAQQFKEKRPVSVKKKKGYKLVDGKKCFLLPCNGPIYLDLLNL